MHPPCHAKHPILGASIASGFIKGEFRNSKGLGSQETEGSSSSLSIIVSGQCVYGNFLYLTPCRILATGLWLHYRKNPHTVGRKQLNDTIVAAKKVSWQFLASVHKTRVAFVNGIQKTPRETRTSG